MSALGKFNKSVAVLPFVNMSDSSDNEFFCDGITEEIINALAKIPGLKVTSRTSSFYFKGKNIPIPEIGQQLDVSILLEGSVRLSGRSMRITAQLIQADEDFHFWSETWDRITENIFAIQDEISLIIAEKLRDHFGHLEIQEHLVSQQTGTLDAYTLYLKGRHLLNKWNPDDANKAIHFFNQALELNSDHALSLAGLADSYSFLATTGFISYEEGWEKCSELTHQALAIDDQLPSAHYQLANISFFVEADYSKAYTHCKKAISINPNHADTLQFMSFLCIIAGRKELAKKHLIEVLKVNPLSQETQFFSAYIDYMLGDYTIALDKLNACLEVNPKNIPAHSVKTGCLLLLNQVDEVLNYFDHMPPDVIVPAEKIGILTLASSLLNDEDKLSEQLEALKQLAQKVDGLVADTFIFMYYGFSGQTQKAFEWIENALESRNPIFLLRFADPLVNPIKEDPRYSKIKDNLYPPSLFTNKEKDKSTKPLMDAMTVEQSKANLFNHMKDEEPYLSPELSLRSLALELDMHPNHLSWLINESIGKNFNEFINHYRIEAFKQLSKDTSKSHYTIMGLAFESGFNSKTVFNTYFKKETGVTPKQFLKGA